MGKIRFPVVCLAGIVALSSAAFSQQISTLTSEVEEIPPLAGAVLAHNSEQISKLLDSRENVDERVRARKGGRAGFTPLILAAAFSDAEIAGRLIKYGAKITILDDYHRSALWYAAFRENVAVLRVLAGASGTRDVINVADDDLKRTPLHIAVNGTAPEAVEVLINLGASWDQKDFLDEPR
jgi:ankyrin repeat protein